MTQPEASATYVLNPASNQYERLLDGWRPFENVFHPDGRKCCLKDFPDGKWALIWCRKGNRIWSHRMTDGNWRRAALPGASDPSKFSDLRIACETLDRALA